jgi:hypothetical protein
MPCSACPRLDPGDEKWVRLKGHRLPEPSQLPNPVLRRVTRDHSCIDSANRGADKALRPQVLMLVEHGIGAGLIGAERDASGEDQQHLV